MKTILLLVLVSFSFSSLSLFGKETIKKVETARNEAPRFKTNNLFKAVHYEGWVKFIEVKENAAQLPTSFEVNKTFFQQKQDNKTLDTLQKDNFGFIYIPSEEYFYGWLDKHDLIIFSGREAKYKYEVHRIKVEEIIPQVSVKPSLKGGIEELGNFTEGFCFIVKFRQGNTFKMWELCTETLIQKDSWIKFLLQAKCPDMLCQAGTGLTPSHRLQQVEAWRAVGPWSPCSKPCGLGVVQRTMECIDPKICSGTRIESKECSLGKCKDKVEDKLVSLSHVANGKMEYLGNWSPCSSVCGEGVMTNRRCLDPTCAATELVTRPCVAPCGGWKVNGPWGVCSLPCGGGVRRRPLVCGLEHCSGNPFLEEPCNIAPCNNALLGNDIAECKAQEVEMQLLAENSLNLRAKVMIDTAGIRIVKQGALEPAMVFDTTRIENISLYSAKPNCIQIVENMNKAVLCRDTQADCEVWLHKILDFRNRCSSKILDKVANCPPPCNANYIRTVQNSVIAEEQAKTAMKTNLMDAQLAEFKRQLNVMTAQEDEYEHKLETGEKKRIEDERLALSSAVAQEQRKATELLADMRQLAENEQNTKIKEMTMKKKMNDLLVEAKTRIAQKRGQLVEKINRMRTVGEIEKRQKAKELVDIKRSLGKQLIELSKQGDPNICFAPSNSVGYCAEKFIGQPEMQAECSNPRQFCYICCGKEINSLDKESKECCYNRCDSMLDRNSCFGFVSKYLIK